MYRQCQFMNIFIQWIKRTSFGSSGVHFNVFNRILPHEIKNERITMQMQNMCAVFAAIEVMKLITEFPELQGIIFFSRLLVKAL